MNRQAKVFLGVASFWPILWLFLIFLFVFFSMFIYMVTGNLSMLTHPLFMVPGVLVWILTFIDILALLAIYVIDLVRNDTMDMERRVLWTGVLLLAAPFAMPAYWYLYIWLGKPEA